LLMSRCITNQIITAMSSYRQLLYHVVFRTKKYIRNQQEHHNKRSFEEEYRSLILKAGIKIDEKYFP
jgi:hypothetical protein